VTSPGNSPLQTSISTAPTAAATSGNPAPGWFGGHQGTARIVLIVVVPVGSLGLLLVVFCYFRHYKLSISGRAGELESRNKIKSRGLDAESPAAVGADSSTRHEMGTGAPLRPELASTVFYELDNDMNGSASVGMKEKTPGIKPSTSPSAHALERGDHKFDAKSPSAVLMPPRAPTIPRKPIALPTH
jgi:hypothetical protein